MTQVKENDRLKVIRLMRPHTDYSKTPHAVDPKNQDWFQRIKFKPLSIEQLRQRREREEVEKISEAFCNRNAFFENFVEQDMH